MAKRIILVDDLDGTSDARPVRFSLDGQSYAIDLSEANHRALSEALAPFVAAATKEARGTAASPRATAPRGARRDVTEVREWARANGYEVAAQGRIPRNIQDAFDAR